MWRWRKFDHVPLGPPGRSPALRPPALVPPQLRDPPGLPQELFELPSLRHLAFSCNWLSGMPTCGRHMAQLRGVTSLAVRCVSDPAGQPLGLHFGAATALAATLVELDIGANFLAPGLPGLGESPLPLGGAACVVRARRARTVA